MQITSVLGDKVVNPWVIIIIKCVPGGKGYRSSHSPGLLTFLPANRYDDNHVCYNVAEALIGSTLCLGFEVTMQINIHKIVRALRIGAIAFFNRSPA